MAGLAEGTGLFFRGYCRKIAVLLICSQLEYNSMHSLWLCLPTDGFTGSVASHTLSSSPLLVAFLRYCYSKRLLKAGRACVYNDI